VGVGPLRHRLDRYAAQLREETQTAVARGVRQTALDQALWKQTKPQ
jgi:hypothetical protein